MPRKEQHPDFEKDIRAAIPLLRIDPRSADVMLTRIARRARKAGDRRATIWALQLLQMLIGVTAREPLRYAKICREVVREDPKRAMSWVFLGSAEEALGRTRAAESAWREALARAKRDPETAAIARKCLAELGVEVRPPRARSRASARRDSRRGARGPA